MAWPTKMTTEQKRNWYGRAGSVPLDTTVERATAAAPAPQVVMVERESASPGRDALMGAYAERVAGYGGFRQHRADQGRNPMTGLMSEGDWRSAFPGAPQSQSRGMSDYWEAARSALYGPQNRTTDQMKAFRDQDPLFQRAGREADGAKFMGDLRLQALKDYYQMNKRAAFESFQRRGIARFTPEAAAGSGFGVRPDMAGARAAAASPTGRFFEAPGRGFGYATTAPMVAVAPQPAPAVAVQQAPAPTQAVAQPSAAAPTQDAALLANIGLSAGTEGRPPTGVGGVARQRNRRTGAYYAGQAARETAANAAASVGLAANDATFSLLDFIRAASGKDPAPRYDSPLTRTIRGMNTLGR